MRIFLKQDVYQAALDRISYIFDEFEVVVVSFSGGKDSTTVLNLALEVAEKKGRLPLPVMFVDQEAEWQCVIDYIRRVMKDEKITPLWYQMPITIENASSTGSPWAHCWEPGKAWIRDKEPGSIHDNNCDTQTWSELFPAIMNQIAGGKKAAFLAGMRAEESPSRLIGLTAKATYKAVTWGKILSRERDHYTFYPLYDWSYTDIWKAIHANGWAYCSLYDVMYQYGVKTQDMRVSNVHHETAIRSLYIMQELEPETWNRVQARLKGVNTAKHLGSECYARPKTLPYMFRDWREYRDHLLENLISDEEGKKAFRKRCEQMEKRYEGMNHIEDMYKAQVDAILVGDVITQTKLKNWERNPLVNTWKRWKRGKVRTDKLKNKYIGI